MGDDGIAGPPAKKRGATRQIAKDDGSDSEGESLLPSESGSFQKASEQVIASRRIVKVRRTGAVQEPSAPNPFASILLLVPETSSAVPPVTLASVTAMEPLGEREGNVVEKDQVIESGSTDGVQRNGCQDEKGEMEEAAEVEAHGSSGFKEEQGNKDGEGKLEMPTSPKVEDDAKKNFHSDGIDAKSEVVIGSNSSELASVLTMDKGLEKTGKNDDGLSEDTGKENGDGLSEDMDKENAKCQSDDKGKKDVKELGESEQGDTEKGEKPAALATSNALDYRGAGTVAPLDAGTSASFSFGTAPSTFETPTAFASFSSSWAAFGSSTTASLGSGFAFSKAASDGAFASASIPFANSNGSSFQLFSVHSSGNTLSSGPPLQPPASAAQFQGGTISTGEEQERMVFGADATLFEFMDGAWKERGKGELRVNTPLDKTGKARLLMRSKGNLRLIMNASLFPDMKLASMDSRGVTFACVNSTVEEKSGLVTYALKFKDSTAAHDFRDAVDAHKIPSREDLKTPESSPTSLDRP